MREIYAAMASRLKSGAPFAAATLVETKNAAPAPIGTSLIVDSDVSITGNIGAGCHEGEIVEAARCALRDGIGRTLEFDMSDELLDGSACGASLAVAIWLPAGEFLTVAERIVAGSEAVAFSCGRRLVGIPRRRRLLIVGATQLASQLTCLARDCDFHVTVVDPRSAFATERRQPHADRLHVGWPDDVLPALLMRADAIVTLAHDVKIDLPALRCALSSGVAYVGALGSRRSHRARLDALRSLGYSEDQLARIHGPTGLDVGAITEAQIACSIVAETLAVLNGTTGAPLRELGGAIRV
jgi:xanthine dehydrogenase accessory factor